MFRFANLQLLFAALQTDPSTVPDLLQIDVMNGQGNTAAEKTAWATAKVQNAITVTIADIAGQAVRNMVGVGQNCNDAAKNLYRYIYHRYSQYNNDLILLATSFFQSTLSKSIAFTNLYSSIQAKQNANPDDPAVFADFGRIFRLLITFEPALVTGRLLAPKEEDIAQEDEEESVDFDEKESKLVIERYFQR